MADTDSRPDVASLSFEDALGELERIVDGLERGQVKLEDAIGAYQRGALLRAHCEAKLNDARDRIRTIGIDATGEPKLDEKPFA